MSFFRIRHRRINYLQTNFQFHTSGIHFLMIRHFIIMFILKRHFIAAIQRRYSSYYCKPEYVEILSKKYVTDECFNISPKVLACVNKKILFQKQHPLWLLKRSIENFFVNKFKTNRGNPVFSFIDNLGPVVSCSQNFDSLLTPSDHPSRKSQDTYYINANTCLRSHTSAHQVELIASGLDAFLCFGDVYRRDSVDRTHYPVFHQVEGVRLFSPNNLADHNNVTHSLYQISKGTEYSRQPSNQEFHSQVAVEALEKNMKSTLELLCKHLFGPNVQFR